MIVEGGLLLNGNAVNRPVHGAGSAHHCLNIVQGLNLDAG